MAVPPLLNSEWLPSFRFASLSSILSLALPLASTVKFFTSPAWWPSGLSKPCFLASGLKCPPADLKSGPSHLGTWWKWMACSPGGRSWRLSSRPTPEPCSQRSTVPTLLPWASLSSTLVLAAAGRAKAAKASVRTRGANRECFIGRDYSHFWRAGSDQKKLRRVRPLWLRNHSGRPSSARGYEAARGASHELQDVSDFVQDGLWLTPGEAHVDEKGYEAHERSVKREAGVDAAANPDRENEGEPGGSD